MVLMLVNCSERKKPPTSSTASITVVGVEIVKAPQAARNADAISVLPTSTVLNPSRRRIMAVAHFMLMEPSAVAKVISPD
jgi:hypothetical protein